MDSTQELKAELAALRDDLNRSTAGRQRLILITTGIGIIGVALWLTVIYLIIQLDGIGCLT